MDASARFYERLKGFAEFDAFPEPSWYRPLPDDWCIVITDVKGSTRAIEEGRYKEVNGVGVASIVALLNALKPLKVPYVFGGDGATACLPMGLLEQVRPALLAAKQMSREQFGLELRIGAVAIDELRADGFDVLVGKHQPHPYYQQAMFNGTGLGRAESLVKEPTAENRYLIRDGERADATVFDGFECRWNEIPSPHEENIALLVQALECGDCERDAIYLEVVGEVARIYGEEAHCHPLREENLSLTASPYLLSIESGIRTAFQSGWLRLRYMLKLQLIRLIGLWVMGRGVKTDATDWGAYKQNLIVNTDYRKFDELLRMVISGSAEQREQLRRFLERRKGEGRLVFGIHAAPSSLITCVVTDYDKDHVHFLDGANGGYAMAARELKRQLKRSSG